MTPDEIHTEIIGLPREDLVRFYAAYLHEITIVARDGYDPIAFEHLRQCNETIHRIAGHLNALFDSGNSGGIDSFARMCVIVAEKRGWLGIVERSLKTRART